MNVIELNTISLNASQFNVVGKGAIDSGSSAGGGGNNAPLDAIGIFIYDIDGKLTAPEDWDSANNDRAVGVYVGTDTHRFVIAKDNSVDSLAWGGYGIEVDNIVTTTNKSNAKLDFDGKNNTNKIITQLSGFIDQKGNVGAPTCEYCANYTSPNGKRGYLGASGEWQMVMDNKYKVMVALNKCGGSSLEGTSWNFTSTQYDSKNIWYYDLSGKWIASTSKITKYKVRPFLSI